MCQTRSYDDASTLTHTSAATVAKSRIAALPVSVRRKLRSGVSRLRAQAVRPANGVVEDSVTAGIQSTARCLTGAREKA